MAKFAGTLKEFTSFIDPRARNNIANMTRKSKQLLDSKCQKCNEVKELDAAHKHGNSRPEIIERVLENYKTKDEQYEIDDVQKVVDEIHDAHLPIENTFLFLCKTCHREYDSWTKNLDHNRSVKHVVSPKSDKRSPKNIRAILPSENHIPPKEILCKDELQSWKYKLGWTSIQNSKNIESLISKIESAFDCNPLAFKSWYFHKRKDNNKQFSGIICHKNRSVLCFRIEPGSFDIDDDRIIRGKRWFFSEGKEARIEIVPENYDLIMKCLSYAFGMSS